MDRIMYRGIQQTKDTCSGKARVKDRRIAVQLIIGELLRGRTRGQIQYDYQVSNEEITCCLGYAIKCVEHFDSRLPEGS